MNCLAVLLTHGFLSSACKCVGTNLPAQERPTQCGRSTCGLTCHVERGNARASRKSLPRLRMATSLFDTKRS